MTLAWLAAKGDERFGAATLMVSMQDFSRVGDTAVFLGEPAVDFIEQQMLERGYLDSRELSNMFNLLRSNDLIWANVVNNYLLGQKPPAFDLLYWNSDGTRMARRRTAGTCATPTSRTTWSNPQGPPEGRGAGPRPHPSGHLRGRGGERPHRALDAALRITQLTAARYTSFSRRAATLRLINRQVAKAPIGRTRTGMPTRPSAGAAATPRRELVTDWFAWLAAHSGEKVEPPSMGARHIRPAGCPRDYVLEK